MIRVELPAHLRTLAGVDGNVELDIASPVSTAAVLDALEARYPVLRGTIRGADRARRPYLRYFADGLDLSFEPADQLLPEAVVAGQRPFVVVGAIAGG